MLCLLVGCAMFAMPDFLSRVAAEGVIMQRGGAESTVSCRINDNGVDVENGAHIPFDQIDRLVEDDQYFYLFQSRQMAVMIPQRQPAAGEPRAVCQGACQRDRQGLAAAQEPVGPQPERSDPDGERSVPPRRVLTAAFQICCFTADRL